MPSRVLGGGDEHDSGQVEGQVQIVVPELFVLRRVENFHQRRGWIAAKIAAEFVDFVQHDDRIGHPGASQRLQNTARHGTDVGAPVAAQLRLVVQAAQAQAFELATHGTCDGLAQRGLADAWRTYEADDRCFGLGV